MSILTPKTKTKTTTISVRIPASLAADLEALKASADAAGFTVDLTETVQVAITKAVKEAQALIAKSAASQPSISEAPAQEPPAPAHRVQEVDVSEL